MHVNAHRSQKEMQATLVAFEKFSTEGNEKAVELVKEEARLDGGGMVKVKAITIQQEREEVYAALQHAATFHCLVEGWKDYEELRQDPKRKVVSLNRNEQRNNARSGVRQHSSKHMKLQGTCEGPKWLREDSKHKLIR